MASVIHAPEARPDSPRSSHYRGPADIGCLAPTRPRELRTANAYSCVMPEPDFDAVILQTALLGGRLSLWASELVKLWTRA